MTLPSFHTHCSFCDGRDSAEDMIRQAINDGAGEIGFSSHAYTAHDGTYCMSIEKTEQYKTEILRLKDKYSHKIKIYLGAEYDYFSTLPRDDYDYIIGSVHYVLKNGHYIEMDNNSDIHKRAIRELYSDDTYGLVRDYYVLVGDVYNKTGADIVGHFDVITKFNEIEYIYDTRCEAYREYALSAAEKLRGEGAIFEINTGAMSRGFKRSPYPENYIMDYLGERGANFVITSDAHSSETMTYNMAEIENLLLNKGYNYFTTMEEIKANKNK